jgi:hypothetical protein
LIQKNTDNRFISENGLLIAVRSLIFLTNNPFHMRPKISIRTDDAMPNVTRNLSYTSKNTPLGSRFRTITLFYTYEKTFRDTDIYESPHEVKMLLGRWVKEYNTVHPHSFLD